MHTPDEALLGAWYHSHEEDRPGRVIFRPAEFSFPPARGRAGFELQKDGKATVMGPGPDDRTTRAVGSWQRVGDLITVSGRQGIQRYRIQSDADGGIVLVREGD